MNIEVIKLSLTTALGDYWDAAYQQGKEGRDHDDKAGSAQDAESRIEAAALALISSLEEKNMRIAELEAAIELSRPLVAKIVQVSGINEELGRVVGGQVPAARALGRIFAALPQPPALQSGEAE